MGKIYASTGTIPEPKAGLEIGRGAATKDRAPGVLLRRFSCGTGGSGCGGCSRGYLGWSIRPPVDFRLLSLNELGCKGPVQSAEEEEARGPTDAGAR